MPGSGTKLLRSGLTAAEHEYVMSALTPEQRRRALLAAADRQSGKRWQELTAALSEQEDSALANWPTETNPTTLTPPALIVVATLTRQRPTWRC